MLVSHISFDSTGSMRGTQVFRGAYKGDSDGQIQKGPSFDMYSRNQMAAHNGDPKFLEKFSS